MNAAQQVSVFLIGTLFTLYIGALLVRILLTATRADFYNPLSQFILTVTDPVIVPARRLVPGFYRIDLASWLVTYILNVAKLFLLSTIQSNTWPLLSLLLYALVDLATLLITILVWVIIILAILSWVGGANNFQNPVVSVLHSLSNPLIQPVRKRLPPIGMIDLSPMIVIIGLYCILIALNSLALV